MSVPEHHTAEFWESIPRHLEWFTVKSLEESADGVTIHQSNGWTFHRSKADLGREIHVGESLALETVKLSQVTGLMDRNGWLFHLTDQDLADQARKFSEDLHRKDVIRLEKNRKQYAEWEAALPYWLKARIQRYRDAGGEKFLLEGWGYELTICRLADLFDRGLEAEAEKLSEEEGCSGNQWDCAKGLAKARTLHGDEVGVLIPSGISPITGSADYS